MSISIKKNILIICLILFFISFLFLGTQYFKFVFCFNILSLFLFSKFQLVNLKIVFINFVSIVFLIIFSDHLDFSRFLILILLFIFSFEFKENKKLDINVLIIFLLVIFFISLFFLYPSSDRYFVMIDIKETPKYLDLYEAYLDGIISKPEEVLFTVKGEKSDLRFCYDEFGKSLNLCDYSFWNYTRLSFNNLDPNLTALILITLANFFSYTLDLNKKYLKIVIFMVLFIIILYATKSRVLYVYLFFYFLSFYLSKFEKKISTVSLFLIFNLLIYFIAFYIEFHSKNIFSNYLSIHRLIDIYDNSIKLRFDQMQDTIILQFYNFQKILMPDHSYYLSKVMFQGREISNDIYSPHNTILALIKDTGLVITLIFLYNLYKFVKNSENVFKFYFLPLLISSTFLGYSVFLLLIFLIFVSTRLKN